MATFRFRNGKWQVQVRLNIGPKITRSFNLKSDAQAWARTTESDIQAGRLKVVNCPATMADILDRYSHEVTVHKRSANKEIGRIRRMLREPFAALKVKDLTPAILNEFKDRRLKEVGAQAVLHDLNLLSHAIKIARMEWGLDLAENPFDLIRKPPQPPSRTRRLKSEELDKLIAAIATRPSRTFQAFVTLAIETGMRRGELLGLHWDNIDLQRSEAYLGMTKNGQARMIPLSPLAHTVLKELFANRKSRRVLPITIPTLRYYWLPARQFRRRPFFPQRRHRHFRLKRCAVFLSWIRHV